MKFKILKEFTEIREGMADRISPGIRNAEREVNNQIKKLSKQSLGLRKAWLDAEARSRVMRLVSEIIEDLKGEQSASSFVSELDITPEEFNKLSVKVIIREIFDGERDNALFFLQSQGIGSVIVLDDLKRSLIQSLKKVRL